MGKFMVLLGALILRSWFSFTGNVLTWVNSSLRAGNAPLAPMMQVKVGVPNGFRSNICVRSLISSPSTIVILPRYYVCKKF